MTPRNLFQILAHWLFSVAFAMGTTVVMVLVLGRFTATLTPAMLNFWGRGMLWISRIRLDVEGNEHVDTREMRIVTFNHGSILDSMIVTAVMRRGGVAAIKREVVYYP